MIRDYILENNLKNIIGRFIKLSFKYSIINLIIQISVCLFLLFKKDFFLTNYERTFFIIMFSTPIFLFIISYFIYENLYPESKPKKTLRIVALFWIIYLFTPSLILFFRYSDFVNVFAIIVGGITIIGLIGVSDKSVNKFKILSVFKDVKYIMFDFWNKRNNQLKQEHFENNLSQVREDQYIDKENLKVFQETISCPLIDVNAIFNNKYFEDIQGEISVLDIGGAEGKFTANLLKTYKSKENGNFVSKIQLIDPVDLKEEYIKNLSSIVDSSNIKNSKITFEKWNQPSPEKYNLVIASHSLYAAIDNKAMSIDDLITKLKRYVKDKNSLVLIILASREGRAYSFKKHALKLIFDEDCYDVDSNKLIQNLFKYDFKNVQTDNYIDLSEYLKEYEDDKKENLIKWLSYFLRVDENNFKAQKLTQIVELLKYYVQPLYELSNYEIENFTKLNFPKPMDKNNSMLLLHKTDIIVL
ncbi:MAG: hypothetical protein V7655_08835 [Aequorivita antarctica]